VRLLNRGVPSRDALGVWNESEAEDGDVSIVSGVSLMAMSSSVAADDEWSRAPPLLPNTISISTHR